MFIFTPRMRGDSGWGKIGDFQPQTTPFLGDGPVLPSAAVKDAQFSIELRQKAAQRQKKPPGPGRSQIHTPQNVSCILSSLSIGFNCVYSVNSANCFST